MKPKKEFKMFKKFPDKALKYKWRTRRCRICGEQIGINDYDKHTQLCSINVPEESDLILVDT